MSDMVKIIPSTKRTPEFATFDRDPLQHIADSFSWHSGGGCMLDIFVLKGGQVLVVDENGVSAYANAYECVQELAGLNPEIVINTIDFY